MRLGTQSLGLILSLCSPVLAQARRAVIVGNDAYLPPTGAPFSAQTLDRLKSIRGKPSRTGLARLEGAYNDAVEIKKVLIARFGFEEKNIVMLPNADQPATADNILGLIKSFLVENTAPGDVSFFYYAGHGSRIRNVSTENTSGLDSTIIPADALRGVPDIRGKELARLYVEAVRKQVHLTVIQDSCFSGAAARGSFGARSRDEPPDNNVSVDEPWTGPLPEDLGVLIMMAAEDYQPAMEIPMADFGGGHHGAFTWALLRTLYSSAPNETADRIFQRTRALLQSRVADQEPVLFAKNGRGEFDLFGQPPDTSVQTYAIAVANVDRGTKLITLNGGQATSLYRDCILKRIVPASPPISIRITETVGFTLSRAVVEDGRIENLNSGDLFELTRWVVPERSVLTLFLGPLLPLSEIRKASAALTPLAKESSIHLVTDPSIEPPTHIVTWDGKWRIAENRPGAVNSILDNLDPATVLRALTGPKEVRLYVRLPLAKEIAANLDLGPASHNPAVAITERTDDARYVLMSRREKNGEINYAWVLPGVTEQDLESQSEQARRDQKRLPLIAQPLASAWAQTADTLTEGALRLARVIGWLDLDEPPAQSPFPFKLALKDADSGKAASNELTGGHIYNFFLDRDDAMVGQVAPRWVYVFVIDSTGCGSLLVPASSANQDDRFPRAGAGNRDSARLIQNSTGDMMVTPPYGTDTYVMLTTGSAVDVPDAIFNFNGVQTRGVGTNPLGRLFLQTGAGSRGEKMTVPADWSLQKLTLRSVPPDTPEAQAALDRELKKDNLSSCSPAQNH